jgi:hypothetical protein
MKNMQLILTVSCGLALATACSSSQSTSGDGGNAGGDATTGEDASVDSGDDGSLLGTPTTMTPDATITCHGSADCGGAGHSCCFSTMTFATMCVTGTCGSNYTQCVTQSDCPAGLQCVVSPLMIAGVSYCVAGDGGAIAEGGATEAGSGVDAGPDASRVDSGADASVDGPAE